MEISHQSCYRVSSEEIAAQILDGELVAMSLKTGVYYSSRGFGAYLWQCLTTGQSWGDLQHHLVKKFSKTETQVNEVCEPFLKSCLDHQLLISCSEAPSPNPFPTFSGDWEDTPQLECFNDMQDLLLVDPIHDSGADGWPKADPAS